MLPVSFLLFLFAQVQLFHINFIQNNFEKYRKYYFCINKVLETESNKNILNFIIYNLFMDSITLFLYNKLDTT